MWRKCENGENTRPADLDTTSSHFYVYIRRNIEHIPETEDTPAHYAWEETKVSKENWGIFERVLNHDTALNDVYEALAEIATLITEG